MEIKYLIKTKLYFSAFILFFCFKNVAAQERVISYNDALKIALKNNLNIKQTTNDIRVNKALVNSSKLNYLPSINGTTNGAKTKGFQFSPQEQALVDQEISTLRANLRADLVVFNGFGNYYSLKRNIKLFEAKKQELEQLKQNIVFETTQKYLQYLLDEEVLKIAKKNEKINSQLFDQVSEFVKEGQRAGLDSISQLAVYERSKLSVTNANNKISLDKLELLRILAIDYEDKVTLIAPEWKVLISDTIGYNSEELINKAYTLRSDLQQLSLEKNAQKQQANFFRGKRLPRVGIFYRYGSEFISNRRRRNLGTNSFEEVSFNDQLFEENIVSQYGFNVTIPILGNFNNKGNIVRAKIEFENKDYEIEDLKRKIALDIRSSINNYYQLKEAYEVAQKVSSAFQLSFEKQKELYDLGLGDLVTLNIESQKNFRIKSEELQAKYTLLFQQKIIDYQIGNILGN